MVRSINQQQTDSNITSNKQGSGLFSDDVSRVNFIVILIVCLSVILLVSIIVWCIAFNIGSNAINDNYVKPNGSVSDVIETDEYAYDDEIDDEIGNNDIITGSDLSGVVAYGYSDNFETYDVTILSIDRSLRDNVMCIIESDSYSFLDGQFLFIDPCDSLPDGISMSVDEFLDNEDGTITLIGEEW